MEPSQQPTIDRPPPHQLQVIRQNIDELVSAVLSSNDAAISQNQNQNQNRTGGGGGGGSSAEYLNDASLRAHQANAIKTFKDLMIEIQRKTSKAVHEVESKLGPSMQAGHANGVADALLQDLLGVAPGGELNRALARMELHGKQSYKLRDVVTANLPSSIVVPQIVVADDGGAAMLPVLGGHEGSHHVVVLQPTLRNVWVVQHAYAKLIHHKEGLIAQYLAAATVADPSNGGRAGAGGARSIAAGPPPPPSRKFAREYYEVLGLANLPSKDKLGNLLDIKSSTYHSDATGDVMLVLVSTSSPLPSPVGNGLTFREAVTGDVIAADNNGPSSGGGGGAHLVLPVTEASIRKLYDAYRALRAATSEQRRASKDKAFAATLPVDEVAELEMQFNFGGGAGGSGVGAGGGATGGRKRRRMLDDED